jgi:hypothetical protein
MAKPVASVSMTILAGEALSSIGNLTAGTPVLLLTPVDWNPAANASLQVSSDGVSFFNLTTAAGDEVAMSMGPSRAVLLPEVLLRAVNFLRIRSGLSTGPILQQGARSFVVVMV